MNRKAPQAGFSGRVGFILAAMGAAVGTGNIWRFPKEAAANGGGAFLIAWAFFLFAWSIPLLMAEFALGKRVRRGTVGAFKTILGPKYAWMGLWMAFISTAIGFYYAVVAGWTVKYATVAISGGINSTVNTQVLWDQFIQNPWQVIAFQAAMIVVTSVIVFLGVKRGIELANKILMPTLVVLLLIAAVWALSQPGSMAGMRYLFVPRVGYFLKADTWISALVQSAWSCSAGMGMAITYGVYVRSKEDIAVNSFLTGLGNNAVSLIAGIAVFATIFSLSSSQGDAEATVLTGGSALTFIHLPRLFATAPQPLGSLLSFIFFLAMSFAALTSMMATMEIAIKNFVDAGYDRNRSIVILAIGTFLLGIPSAVLILHRNGAPVTAFLDNQDHVWGLGLMVSGLFMTFLVWKFGVDRFRRKIVNSLDNDMYVGRWFNILFYTFPFVFVFLLAWFMVQTYSTNPSNWWMSGPVGLLLMLGEWAVVLVILIITNRLIQSRFKVDVPRPLADVEGASTFTYLLRKLGITKDR